MTDNVFEIETAALAHRTCMFEETGILLTDFACANSSVNHGWMFRLLAKAGLPPFLQSFLSKIYVDSTTSLEHAGQVRGHFAMTRSVRPGCPASGFIVTMVFEPDPSMASWYGKSEGPPPTTVVAADSTRQCR